MTAAVLIAVGTLLAYAIWRAVKGVREIDAEPPPAMNERRAADELYPPPPLERKATNSTPPYTPPR